MVYKRNFLLKPKILDFLLEHFAIKIDIKYYFLTNFAVCKLNIPILKSLVIDNV